VRGGAARLHAFRSGGSSGRLAVAGTKMSVTVFGVKHLIITMHLSLFNTLISLHQKHLFIRLETLIKRVFLPNNESPRAHSRSVF
jgi:hypothetical protein